MPIRSRLAGTLDETDLSMLEGVLSRVVKDGSDEREHFAMQLIQLFQAGVTDPDELLKRVNETF